MIGVNFFYRKVKDLIELVNTGDISVARATGFVLHAAQRRRRRGVGHRVRPLDAADGDRAAEHRRVRQLFLARQQGHRSEFGSRGASTTRRSPCSTSASSRTSRWGAAFGATYRKQGDAFARVAGETVKTTYGADLEVFLEKRFGEPSSCA